MTAPYGFTPEGAYTPESLPLMQSLTEEKIRARLRKPVDDAMGKMASGLHNGLVANIGRALRGEGLPGFESVRDAVQDGLLPGIADAVRGVADLPGQYTPIRDAVQDGVLQGVADAMRGVEDLGSQLIPVRDAARALIRPVENRVAQVEESQLSAEEQLALLEGVRSYGAVYQPRNFGGNVNSVALNFTAPMGPMKGVSVDPVFKGLRVNEPGLWLVSVRATGRPTAATNGLGQQDRTELTVRESPPGIPSRPVAVMTGDGGNGRVSNTMTFPMVIEQAGTIITVDAYSSRWRWWDGGKLYSNLSVTKLDSRLENPGDWTVPDA